MTCVLELRLAPRPPEFIATFITVDGLKAFVIEVIKYIDNSLLGWALEAFLGHVISYGKDVSNSSSVQRVSASLRFPCNNEVSSAISF